MNRPSEEVARIFSRKHNTILEIVAGIGRFESIFDKVKNFAYQMIRDPVIENGFSESIPVIASFNGFFGYYNSGKYKTEYLEFIKEARQKGIWPTEVIGTLATEKQEDAIDYFIDCFKKLDSNRLDSTGLGIFVDKGLTHELNFLFSIADLEANFGMDKIKEKFAKETLSIRDELNKLFNQYVLIKQSYSRL